MYVGPAARAVECSGTKLVESTFMPAGSVDAMTREVVMLDAVLLAESLDHANWTAMTPLSGELPDGALKEASANAVTEVDAGEDDHLMWAQETRTELIELQATSPMTAPTDANAEGCSRPSRAGSAPDRPDPALNSRCRPGCRGAQASGPAPPPGGG